MLHSVDAQFVADPRRLISETDCAGHHKFPRSTATGESSGKSAATMNYFWSDIYLHSRAVQRVSYDQTAQGAMLLLSYKELEIFVWQVSPCVLI